jgi:surface antigen
MMKTARNLIIATLGVSVAALTALPASADGYRDRHSQTERKVVRIVKIKKIIYEPADYRRYNRSDRYDRRDRRYYKRSQRRSQRKWRRSYDRRPVRNVYQTTIVRPAPVSYPRYSNGNVTGGLIGAVLGGILGNQFGGGGGKVAMTVGGAVLGAVIGGDIGNSMDRVDRVHTQTVLESSRTGKTVTWRNPDSGRQYSMTPSRTYQRESGEYCRDFTTWGWIDGYEEKLRGTACRTANGKWRQSS